MRSIDAFTSADRHAQAPRFRQPRAPEELPLHGICPNAAIARHRAAAQTFLGTTTGYSDGGFAAPFPYKKF